MAQRRWRQVRRRRSDRLHTGLFIVRDDRDRRGFLLLRDGGLLQQRDLAIDAQDLGHLLVEQRIAAFQIIAHLVRLDLMRGENFAQRALSKIGEAFVSCRRPMFANVSRQQPRRPQFMRIAQFLGFAASKIDDESSRFFCDDPLASRTRTVVESHYDAKLFAPAARIARPFDA